MADQRVPSERTEFAVGQASYLVREMLKAVSREPGHCPRSLAIARTQFETAFLWIANAATGEAMFAESSIAAPPAPTPHKED